MAVTTLKLTRIAFDGAKFDEICFEAPSGIGGHVEVIGDGELRHVLLTIHGGGDLPWPYSAPIQFRLPASMMAQARIVADVVNDAFEAAVKAMNLPMAAE